MQWLHTPVRPQSCADRRDRQLRPCLLPLEDRVVPSLSGITGIAFDTAETSDTSADLFISDHSTEGFSGQQQQSIAEVTSTGYLVNSSVFSTTGALASPCALFTVGSSDSLPSVTTKFSSFSASWPAFLFTTRSAELLLSTTICRTTPRRRRMCSTCRRAPRPISAVRSV